MIPQPTQGRAIAETPNQANARRQAKALATRRHSRTELLRLVASMASELEERAGSPADGRQARRAALDCDTLACLRAARHLREVLSIAEGRKSAAYWRRKSVA